LLDELFSLKILINRFVDEANTVFNNNFILNTVFNNNFILNRKSFRPDLSVRPDLSENAISLKKQIYTHILLNNIDEKSLISCIETFLANRNTLRKKISENRYR